MRLFLLGDERMGAWELKHEALLMEWQEKIMACRSSGISVKTWCEERGIDRRKYYRWEKEILAKASRQLAVGGGTQPAFVEVRAAVEAAVPDSEFREGMAVARLHTACGEVDVYRGADRETLQAIIEALKDAERL